MNEEGNELMETVQVRSETDHTLYCIPHTLESRSRVYTILYSIQPRSQVYVDLESTILLHNIHRAIPSNQQQDQDTNRSLLFPNIPIQHSPFSLSELKIITFERTISNSWMSKEKLIQKNKCNSDRIKLNIIRCTCGMSWKLESYNQLLLNIATKYILVFIQQD